MESGSAGAKIVAELIKITIKKFNSATTMTEEAFTRYSPALQPKVDTLERNKTCGVIRRNGQEIFINDLPYTEKTY